MKSSWPFLLLLLSCLTAEIPSVLTAAKDGSDAASKADHLLAGKIFPLFSELAADSIFYAALLREEQLTGWGGRYKKRVRQSLDTCSSAQSLAQAFKWSKEEIALVTKNVLALYEKRCYSPGFPLRIRKSNACIAYDESNTKLLLEKAMADAAHGLNRIYDIYIAGLPPAYAAIDAVRADWQSERGFRNCRDSIRQVLTGHQKHQSFYSLAVSLAIKALQMSGRDEAIRYEPIISGINKEVFDQVPDLQFSKYRYSAILVPGFGPEEPGLNIDPRSVRRCQMAAEHFRKKTAPLIIVSGGHVYPAGTPFSEAVEMKKYLVAQLNIPAAAIITEPYARHTTTNVRNASRLVYLFGLPDNKPVFVCTDSVQTQMVVNLAARCKRELGFVPFRNVQQLGATASAFYPVPQALQVNVNDPLDP